MVERLPGIHKALGSSPSTRRSGGGGGGGASKLLKFILFFLVSIPEIQQDSTFFFSLTFMTLICMKNVFSHSSEGFLNSF